MLICEMAVLTCLLKGLLFAYIDASSSNEAICRFSGNASSNRYINVVSAGLLVCE